MCKETRLKAYAAGALFSVLVGFSFFFVKICVPLASTIEISVFRYDFAFLAISIAAAIRRVKVGIKGKKNRALFGSACLYVSFMALQAAGLIFATTIESAIIFAFIPIIAIILAGIFLGERATWRQNIFVCVSVAALVCMILISAGDLTVSVLGIVILLLSSVCMAGSNVLMRSVRREHSPFTVAYVISAFGFVIFNLGYAGDMIREQRSLLTYFAPFAHFEFVLAAAYLGVFCTVLSIWLMSYMLAHMEAVKATMFGNVSTAVSIVAGVVLLGEALTVYHIICTALILIGVAGVSTAGKRRQNETGDS